MASRTLLPHRLPLYLTALPALLAGCQPVDAPDPERNETAFSYVLPDQPEMATGYEEKPGWAAQAFAVAAANPLAADAGFQILDAGGSALDAAIAVQMVLTLVEPQSSGIGGGAFLLHWDGTEVAAFNGRETAPQAADGTLFLDEEGEPLPFPDAVRSGLSVGVPGTIAMLAEAHAELGRLSWADLFEPAVRLAESGFQVSPRLHALLAADERLPNDSIARHLYYDEGGDAHPAGHLLRNPALAEVLRAVAAEGPPAFYAGRVAEDIAARVRSHPERPGTLAVEDLEAYPQQDFRVDPLCSEWRGYELCGFPPPSSGHLAIAQILGILEFVEHDEVPLRDGVPGEQWLHNYLEAARLAFADRARYVADPRYVEPPAGDWRSLFEPGYLRSRAQLIRPASMGTAEAGRPGEVEVAWGEHPRQPDAGTSHISIVDADGNAVAMTTTIESGFGSGIMSDGGTGLPGGFHLNNELTDFSLVPEDADGRPIANRVEPGKRPRSSMSPTLVFEGSPRRFVASVGSPGGAGIIHYTAKALLGMLAWGLNAQESIDVPNFANYNGPSALEAGRFPTATSEGLRSRGHTVEERALTSGLHAVERTADGGLFGGADPRREGTVRGR